MIAEHCVILDIGKTNKKVIVFDQNYNIVFSHSEVLYQTEDEDGYPCEDIDVLKSWMINQINTVLSDPMLNVKAINFSAYGASFVLLDSSGVELIPLYNYLKPIDEKVIQSFYDNFGDEIKLSIETSSPSLGMLNSGLQLYRLKFQKRDKYDLIGTALHLPQYCNYIFTDKPYTELTSLGCHTMLWNFSRNKYHEWVIQGGFDEKFGSIKSAQEVSFIHHSNKSLAIGSGLHDSSAALIPYLKTIFKPFILLSTGTWCIALNPFNDVPLTSYELKHDCLCYLTYEGKPVKASRLFLGHEHEEQVLRLATHFSKDDNYFQTLCFYEAYMEYDGIESDLTYLGSQGLYRSGFEKRNWYEFKSAEMAYHILIHDLIKMQKKSIRLIQNDIIKEIYVDGGFAKNEVFMHVLARALPDLNVYSSIVSQASALGAAMVIHSQWNSLALPGHPIQFERYAIQKKL